MSRNGSGDVIDLSSENEEEEEECRLAQIDSEVCEIQRKIDNLVNRKEDLLAKKNLLLDRAKVRIQPGISQETMLTTLRNEDCILVMPTGGGKSLTFQLPALASSGVTVVVSPLISLMEDQVSGLKKRGFPAAMICGTTPQEEQSNIQKSMWGDTG
eukprot:sb/3473188/